jgi:serine/threonine protein phosphatase PrpC
MDDHYETRTLTTMTVSQVGVAGLSDIGCKRKNNEDSFGFDEEAKIFLVCDGMGGMAAGEIASRMAVEHTLQTFKSLDPQEMSLENRLHHAINSANEIIWNLAQVNPQLHGMGTTLVAACVVNNAIVFGNVGDSRAYFLRNGTCVQVTEDHSCAAEQKKSGKAMELPSTFQQMITRAVGAEFVVKPDFFVAELKPGDQVLLATDGLTRYADEQQLALYLRAEEDLQAACRSLISLAHQKGAEDNVTCLLLRFY